MRENVEIIEKLEARLYKERYRTSIKQPYLISLYKDNGDVMFLIYKAYKNKNIVEQVADFTDTEKAILILFQSLDIKTATRTIAE